MVKKYSSLNSKTTLEFNKKNASKFSSLVSIENMKANWFFMFLLFACITKIHNTKEYYNTNPVAKIYSIHHSDILKSSVAEGRGGGGGHGNYDWVNGILLLPVIPNLAYEISIKTTT